jgi:putative ABC transport system substrate-binding protein
LLSEIAPGLKRAAIMFNPDTNPVSVYMPSFETAARSLKIAPMLAPVRNDEEIETAIHDLGSEPGGGLFVSPIIMRAHRASIISATARNNVPAIYNLSAFARDGGLLSYGVDRVDLFRRAASYVDRILRGAAAWPLAARAQQGDRVRRIGVLTPWDENDPLGKTIVSAFTQALADSGWTDGRNARMDIRWAGPDINRIRALAQELVGLQPDIIATFGALATVALQRETPTIPIVFAVGDDPVASGIVARLNQPGGNITGFASFEPSLIGKWLELLSEIAPGLKRAAIMFNRDTASASAFMPSFETAARSLKVAPIIAPVHSDAEIETAIKDLGRDPGGGLVVIRDIVTVGHRASIILAAARNKVPVVYSLSDFARDGGLLSYGPDLVDTFRRPATYVDRILRGEKAGYLPVQLPTKFEMVVNRKTAKALGLEVPLSILLRADEVIE